MLSQQNPLRDAEGHHRAHANSRARNQVDYPTDSQFLKDLERGRFDIEFFALRFFGIQGNPGQVAWWKLCVERMENGWSPKYLTTVVSAGNRAGKTLGMAVAAFHHSFYKLGLKPPRDQSLVEVKAWLRLPYIWYHVAPQQSQAEILHKEIARILTGTHEAQPEHRCPLIEECGPLVDMATKDRGEYLMISIHPLFGGGQIHFRSAQEKAKALLGLNAHGISYDEAGVEMYLFTVFQEVLNLRRLSTGGPLHLIGTPTTGLNEYYDMWELGNPENPLRDPRVISMRLPTSQNVGFGITQENYDAMERQTDAYLIPQNLGGEFVEAQNAFFGGPSVEAAFIEGLEPDRKPEKCHSYVQGVDTGISSDSTWAITLDYTDSKAITGVRAERKNGRQSIPGIVNMVRTGSLLYSQDGSTCMTVVDSTGMGGKMVKEEFAIISPLRDFDFGGTKGKKLGLLSDLKAVLDRGLLRLPRAGGAWGDLRRQLLSYRLDDKKIEQDAVMAFALAVHHAIRNTGEGIAPTFTFFGTKRPKHEKHILAQR